MPTICYVIFETRAQFRPTCENQQTGSRLYTLSIRGLSILGFSRVHYRQSYHIVMDGNRNADILIFVGSPKVPASIDRFMDRFILYRSRRVPHRIVPGYEVRHTRCLPLNLESIVCRA